MPNTKHIIKTKPLYFLIVVLDVILKPIRAFTMIGIWNASPKPKDKERTKFIKYVMSVLTLIKLGPTVWKKLSTLGRTTKRQNATPK